MDEAFIYLNDVLVPHKENRASINCPHVVIFIDATTDRLFAMNLTANMKPSKFSYRSFLNELSSGELIKGQLALPDYMHLPDQFISKKQREGRDQKFQVIKPLLDNLEEFLVSRNYGSRLVEQCLEIAGSIGVNTRRTHLYGWVYRYFKSGCNVNAFLRKPGSGLVTNKNYTSKTGPKRDDGLVGRMCTEKDKRNIEATVRKYIMCSAPMSLPQAFIQYQDNYESEPQINFITGEITEFKRLPSEQRLTEGQFKYHARAFINSNIDKVRAAQGKTDSFRKDQKGLKGNIEEFYAEGPGHVYQIDETPLDIELVDELDPTRSKRLGKPTCYSVIDMFSRAWIGLLLTFAKASAHTAREVLFVAFRNKGQFCKEIGIELTEEWPFEGKCRIIFVDNAEFKAELERSFSKDAQIEQIYNTEGNSQQKGLVERRHKTLEDFLYGLVPGVGRKKIADYIKRRLRRDALINIRELYQILIDFITRYNNHYPIEQLPLTKKMRLDGVEPIALSKWNWGLLNRPGYLKPATEEELYLSLLEVGEVTVHRDHLFLPGKYLKKRNGKNTKGLKYVCSWTYENGVQDLQKGHKLPRLACRFMRYSLGQIFIETKEGLKPAFLHHTDAIYAEMSDELIINDKRQQAVLIGQLKENHSEKQSKTRTTAEAITTAAKLEQTSISIHEATSQDISANRDHAISREIETSKAQFKKLGGISQSPGSTIVDDQVPQTSAIAQPETETNSTSTIFANKLAAKRKSRKRTEQH